MVKQRMTALAHTKTTKGKVQYGEDESSSDNDTGDSYAPRPRKHVTSKARHYTQRPGEVAARAQRLPAIACAAASITSEDALMASIRALMHGLSTVET
jgi:hypothetical protein